MVPKAPQTYEVKSNRWYRLEFRKGVLFLRIGGNGKAPNPFEIDEITISAGIREVVVQYPDRTDASVSQKFVWNYVGVEQTQLCGYAWVVIDLGLDEVLLRLKMF